MRLLFRVVALAVVLLGGGWAVLFCLANGAAVPLDLLIVRLPEAPLAVWVLGAFVAGGISGLLAASVALWRVRLALRAARRNAAHGPGDTPAGVAKVPA
jgi:uncharacterized integral membrane protein